MRAAFVDFTAPLEGVVPWMYLDVKGLVTTGIGNLVDPMSMALGLPWRRANGTPATVDEIAAEWQRVKGDPHAAKLGHKYAQRITTLRLSDAGVHELVMGKLDANDALLRKRFPGWELWPADAQLATHSMAWACGPAFRFPRLEDSLRALDFRTAAVECRMDETGNPGLRPRNVANRLLYLNAAAVVESGNVLPNLKPDVLYYPLSVAPGSIGPEDDTIPELDAYRSESEPAIVHSLRLAGLPGNDDEPPDAA